MSCPFRLPDRCEPSNYGEVQYDVREKSFTARLAARVTNGYLRAQDEGTYPAVLVVHGGAWRLGQSHPITWLCDRVIPNGFVCFAIDYRLAPKHKFPAQIEDCGTAVKWIRKTARSTKLTPPSLVRSVIQPEDIWSPSWPREAPCNRMEISTRESSAASPVVHHRLSLSRSGNGPNTG